MLTALVHDPSSGRNACWDTANEEVKREGKETSGQVRTFLCETTPKLVKEHYISPFYVLRYFTSQLIITIASIMPLNHFIIFLFSHYYGSFF